MKEIGDFANRNKAEISCALLVYTDTPLTVSGMYQLCKKAELDINESVLSDMGESSQSV